MIFDVFSLPISLTYTFYDIDPRHQKNPDKRLPTLQFPIPASYVTTVPRVQNAHWGSRTLLWGQRERKRDYFRTAGDNLNPFVFCQYDFFFFLLGVRKG